MALITTKSWKGQEQIMTMFFFCVSASRTQDIHKLCCQSLCVNSFSSSPLFGKIQLWLGGLTVEVISPSVALACD